VFVSKTNLQLLPTILVLSWPFTVIFLHDFRVLDDALDLRNDESTDTHLGDASIRRLDTHRVN
jgi:hypothetical protein